MNKCCKKKESLKKALLILKKNKGALKKMKILSLILGGSFLFFFQAKGDLFKSKPYCGTKKFSLTGNLNHFNPYSHFEGTFKNLPETAYIKIEDKVTKTLSLHKNISVREDGAGNFEYEAFFFDEVTKRWKKSLSFFYDHEAGLSGWFYFVPSSLNTYDFKENPYYELSEASCDGDVFYEEK